MKTIGVLALQGDFARHQVILQSLGREVVLVRTPADLELCAGLIIPGGESTTLTLLLKKHQLWDPIVDFAKKNHVFGTCAGLILLSKTIINESMQTLDLIDIQTARNAYGRQIDSFIDDLNLQLNGKKDTCEGVFIRAPKIISLGEQVKPLAWHKNDVVLVEQGNILAATFHPELSENPLVHNYFLSKID